MAPYAQGWGYATVNPKFVEEYEDGDTRRTASVIDIKGEGLEDNQLVQTCIVQSQEYTGYYIKKYAPLAFADGTHAGMETVRVTWWFQTTRIMFKFAMPTCY